MADEEEVIENPSTESEPEPTSVETPAEVPEEKPAETPVEPTPAPVEPKEPEKSEPVPAPHVQATRMSAGAHMREVVRQRKGGRLEKIIEMAAEKRVIVNDDVEKLLKVSDATATRYLSELVKNGRLKKSGVLRAAKYEAI